MGGEGFDIVEEITGGVTDDGIAVVEDLIAVIDGEGTYPRGRRHDHGCRRGR